MGAVRRNLSGKAPLKWHGAVFYCGGIQGGVYRDAKVYFIANRPLLETLSRVVFGLMLGYVEVGCSQLVLKEDAIGRRNALGDMTLAAFLEPVRASG